MMSSDEAAATNGHPADKYLSSSASYIANDSIPCKLAYQFPSSAENIKKESSRLDLIRDLKPSETPPIEEISSKGDALVQVIPKKTNVLSPVLPKPTPIQKSLHEEAVRDALSSGDGPSHAYKKKKQALSSQAKKGGSKLNRCQKALHEEAVRHALSSGDSPSHAYTKKKRDLSSQTEEGGSTESLVDKTTPTSGKKRSQPSKILFHHSKVDMSEQQWDERYEELASYVKKFGNARVPATYPENKDLGYWVNTQRHKYKEFQNGNTSCSITNERIQLLNKIGFKWSLRCTDSWENRYEELVSYKETFGHTRVPQKFPENELLGLWVRKQRSNYTKTPNRNTSCSITKNRIRLMNKIGFEWSLRDTWNVRYKELVSFVKEFGHACVPHRFAKNLVLAIWVHTQRRNYMDFQSGIRSCSLTRDRILLLNKIGFEWGKNRFYLWDVRYKELVSYKNEFGHTRVPTKFTKNPTLGYWVGLQRSSYRNFLNASTLCGIGVDQIKLLNNIGFEWHVHSIDSSSSDSQYKDLLSYEKDFDDAVVPQRFAESHLKGGGLTHKEGIIEETQNKETSRGKIKVMEFSC